MSQILSLPRSEAVSSDSNYVPSTDFRTDVGAFSSRQPSSITSIPALQKVPAAKNAAAEKKSPLVPAKDNGKGKFAVGAAVRPEVMVDATSVIWTHQFLPTFEVLLAVLTDIAVKGFNFAAIFDWTTKRTLRHFQGTAYEERYLSVLKKYPDNCMEVRNIKADALVLATAKHYDSPIVSSDRYSDYEESHPWIADHNFVRVNRCLDVVLVGETVLLLDNVDLAMSKFEKAMANLAA